MRFYRPISRPKAFTFDLDDTLYDNRQVILTTVEKTHQALQNWHPSLSGVTAADYDQARAHIERHYPSIVDDVTAWRHATLKWIIQQAGFSHTESNDGADDIMKVFHRWRSAADISSTTHQVLTRLAQHVPLVAITNGNADAKTLGIEHHFQLILRAGPDGKAKPACDLYQLAAEKLGLPPQDILHVGDNLITDVQGALVAGYQACWINDRDYNLATHPEARLVPHLEISRLDSLTSLL